MQDPIVITEKTGNNLLWVAGSLAVLGLGIYYYNRMPKKAGVHGIQNASQQELQALAQGLHGDIDGITIINEVTLYQQANALSDGDFIRLYNIYNELYQQQDGETLTVAVNGEFAWIGNYSFKVVKEQFLGRCAALNLV